MVNTVLVRTPSHGGSLTLYAGWTDELVPRESGILIKYASVDSSQLANFQSAQLVLFRRTFGEDTLPDSSLAFNLFTIDSQDTIWTESDTAGHVKLDLLETETTLALEGTAYLSTAPITLPGEDTTTSRTDLEYLAFEVDSTILSAWRREEVANNGFLIRQESQGTLVGFYSGENIGLSPYLALTITDTTSTGGDTTIYYPPTGDLSIYPPNPDNSIDSDGSLHLDHSSGIRSHLDFAPYFDPDTTRIVTGARLVLYVNHDVPDVPPIVADQVDLQVRRRAQPLAEGDSTRVLIEKLTYSNGSDSLILPLGLFLSGVVSKAFKNYGLDLVVIPNNHDFDHLVFWGASAPDNLKKPRLEIIYSSLYKEVP